jgi:hypothetical protein
MVRMDRVLALRARVASGGAAVAMRGALGYLNECALLSVAEAVGSVLVFGDAHALELSHAESVPRTCHYVEIPAVQSQQQSPSVENANMIVPNVVPRPPALMTQYNK